MMKPLVSVTKERYDALMALLYAATQLLQEHAAHLTVPANAVGDMYYFMDAVTVAGELVEGEESDIVEATLAVSFRTGALSSNCCQ
jgi:hypothetical protein